MAEIDIYSTHWMEGVIREKPAVYTFIKDRYFGGTPGVFKTEKVYVDYDDGEGNLMAPFVIPRIGKVPMDRSGYETRELTPAYIAPSRPLSIDILSKRLAGENLVSTMQPAQRERVYLVGDLDFLDKTITRREEWMCVNTMLDNACTMEHIGDKAEEHIDLVAQYYDGSANPGVFKPSAKWDVGTASKRGVWYDDVCKQIESMTEAGREVTDLLVGSDVAAMILNDPWVIKMLDNRRGWLGEVNPKWQPNGVTKIAVLNFDGVELEIFSYRGSYQEKNAKGKLETKRYLPATAAVLAAPNTGKLRYGAVTQVELDHNTYTRTGARVPKHNVNVESNTKETILTSRPNAAPIMKSPWRACRDVFTK